MKLISGLFAALLSFSSLVASDLEEEKQLTHIAQDFLQTFKTIFVDDTWHNLSYAKLETFGSYFDQFKNFSEEEVEYVVTQIGAKNLIEDHYNNLWGKPKTTHMALYGFLWRHLYALDRTEENFNAVKALTHLMSNRVESLTHDQDHFALALLILKVCKRLSLEEMKAFLESLNTVSANLLEGLTTQISRKDLEAYLRLSTDSWDFNFSWTSPQNIQRKMAYLQSISPFIAKKVEHPLEEKYRGFHYYSDKSAKERLDQYLLSKPVILSFEGSPLIKQLNTLTTTHNIEWGAQDKLTALQVLLPLSLENRQRVLELTKAQEYGWGSELLYAIRNYISLVTKYDLSIQNYVLGQNYASSQRKDSIALELAAILTPEVQDIFQSFIDWLQEITQVKPLVDSYMIYNFNHPAPELIQSIADLKSIMNDFSFLPKDQSTIIHVWRYILKKRKVPVRIFLTHIKNAPDIVRQKFSALRDLEHIFSDYLFSNSLVKKQEAAAFERLALFLHHCPEIEDELLIHVLKELRYPNDLSHEMIKDIADNFKTLHQHHLQKKRDPSKEFSKSFFDFAFYKTVYASHNEVMEDIAIAKKIYYVFSQGDSLFRKVKKVKKLYYPHRIHLLDSALYLQDIAKLEGYTYLTLKQTIQALSKFSDHITLCSILCSYFKETNERLTVSKMLTVLGSLQEIPVHEQASFIHFGIHFKKRFPDSDVDLADILTFRSANKPMPGFFSWLDLIHSPQPANSYTLLTIYKEIQHLSNHEKRNIADQINDFLKKTNGDQRFTWELNPILTHFMKIPAQNRQHVLEQVAALINLYNPHNVGRYFIDQIILHLTPDNNPKVLEQVQRFLKVNNSSNPIEFRDVLKSIENINAGQQEVVLARAHNFSQYQTAPHCLDEKKRYPYSSFEWEVDEPSKLIDPDYLKALFDTMTLYWTDESPQLLSKLMPYVQEIEGLTQQKVGLWLFKKASQSQALDHFFHQLDKTVQFIRSVYPVSLPFQDQNQAPPEWHRIVYLFETISENTDDFFTKLVRLSPEKRFHIVSTWSVDSVNNLLLTK